MTSDDIEAIKRRQQAKLLTHLRNSGQSTERLEADICRSFNWFSQDVQKAIGHTQESDHGHHPQK